MFEITALPALVVVLDGESAVECDRRPTPAVIAGSPGDHPPALDLDAVGSRVRLALADGLTAAEADALHARLSVEVLAWLSDVAQYAHDVRMREWSE